MGFIIAGSIYAVFGIIVGLGVHSFSSGDEGPTLRSVATATACGLLWPITVVVGLWALLHTDFSK